MDFVPFPKIARLNREIIVTEKIDGTNATVGVQLLDEEYPGEFAVWEKDGVALYAGSKNRWITPANDNFGFAAWVVEHAEELAMLGPGLHRGEWWGAGIQRGYGLPKGEKRFSLFNTAKWADAADRPACCHVVPVLYAGPFRAEAVDSAMDRLACSGSVAAIGFMRPEGIVVFHTAANMCFKATIFNDSEPKSLTRA